MPLFVLVSLVAVAATFGTLVHHKGNLFHWLRDFMGVFFLVFGALKLIKIKDFALAFAEYDPIAMRSKAYALAYPFIEIAFGILILTDTFPKTTNALVAIVMLIGAWGVYQKLKKKEKIQCACLGTLFKVPMT